MLANLDRRLTKCLTELRRERLNMIVNIRQYSPLNNERGQVSKLSKVNLHINTSELSKVIDEQRSKRKELRYSADRKEADSTIDYLDRLKMSSSGGFLDVCWSESGGIAYDYPVGLSEYVRRGLDLKRIIDLSEGENLVELEFSKVADLISFELMNRDLPVEDGSERDFSIEVLEDILSDVGLAGDTDFSVAKERLFPNDSPYELAASGYRVEKSSYINYETDRLYDYFSHSEFDPIRYREAVRYSVRHAALMIVEGIIEDGIKATSGVKGWKLAAIGDTKAYFTFKGVEVSRLREILKCKVVVVVAGRKFGVNIDIKVC